ncbi:MAG: hypothetical protein C0399_12840 [Syntrophus sp. (in: bacteria)]|nr:hypothetical protein [Syntrophus sp. (in: bacteria)]
MYGGVAGKAREGFPMPIQTPMPTRRHKFRMKIYFQGKRGSDGMLAGKQLLRRRGIIEQLTSPLAMLRELLRHLWKKLFVLSTPMAYN